MIIKVCGMREPDNIRAVETSGPDWMGFIFFSKSKRWVGIEPPSYIPRCKKVGVFVNETPDAIFSVIDKWALDMVQLHGDETPEFCVQIKTLGVEVIKAFPVGDMGVPLNISEYNNVCDYFLFDTACASYGGSGCPFDWACLEQYQGPVPFLLSGGITPASLKLLRNFYHPKCVGVDINSGFEIKPGLKDPQLVQHFINTLRQ